MESRTPTENSVAREKLREAMERWLQLAAKVRELAESLAPAAGDRFAAH
jgi:hypothetical protein